ncbi:MAG: SpoIIE family protein phosphatase, partial [Proteobacteria bacterium]|nr:SpoIIE family protein phosphatase [Pseudomonadota bacterium]
LARSREVTIDLHNDRQSLGRQECRVVAEEPRLKAVVATEDVARETILDAVRTLSETLHAGVFVIVDAEGRLIADSAAPDDAGFDLMGRSVVKQALATGAHAGVWIADGKAFLVQGCRLEFGARVVGALVIGHVIGDEFADMVAKHTGGMLIVTVDKRPITRLPAGVGEAEVAARIDEIVAGQTEVTLAGTSWYGQVLPVPGFESEHIPRYILLRSIDEALAPARRIVRILVVIVVGAALATLLTAFVLARRLARPIDALVARTTAIAQGDLSPRAVTGPTEVRALGVAMDRMAKEIDDSRAALADKARLEGELAIAARIQTSILPRDLRVPGLEIAARMVTATEVGGDYYDLVRAAEGCWIAIGDASGHGLTSGLVMMMVQAGFASLVQAQPDTSPRAVVRALNTVLYENIHDRLEAERHMTLSLLRYRPTGELVVAGAHMDAVVWRAKTRTIELLATPGTFLAIAEDIERVNVERTWQLDEGDLLVLLTDGVTEAEDAAGQPFEYRGVIDVVEAHAEAPVAAIRDAIFAALARHSPVLADDATLLILRRMKAAI